jgi:hypothetical protein
MDEEALAHEIASLVRGELQKLGVQIDALASRVNGLEAQANLRGTLDQLGQRMDRLERAKAAVVRLPSRSGAA